MIMVSKPFRETSIPVTPPWIRTTKCLSVLLLQKTNWSFLVALGSFASSVFCMSGFTLCKVYVIRNEPEDGVNIQVFGRMSGG